MRAAALRQYNAAFQSMNPNDFPDLEQLPRSWGRVIGLALVAEIARQGVTQFRDPLLALARPALTINAERFDHLFPEHNPPDRDPTTPIGSSKIFGLPDLPSGSAGHERRIVTVILRKALGSIPRQLAASWPSSILPISLVRKLIEGCLSRACSRSSAAQSSRRSA